MIYFCLIVRRSATTAVAWSALHNSLAHRGLHGSHARVHGHGRDQVSLVFDVVPLDWATVGTLGVSCVWSVRGRHIGIRELLRRSCVHRKKRLVCLILEWVSLWVVLWVHLGVVLVDVLGIHALPGIASEVLGLWLSSVVAHWRSEAIVTLIIRL